MLGERTEGSLPKEAKRREKTNYLLDILCGKGMCGRSAEKRTREVFRLFFFAVRPLYYIHERSW
jgi:hypothetical protein